MTPSPDLAPSLSVVVPTHNRSASVVRLLRALEQQTLDPWRFELIVVADGCTDDTANRLRTPTFPFAVRLIEQVASGPSVARNRGAQAARGGLLLFLDDDTEPDPRTLAAHVAWHGASAAAAAGESADGAIGIGDLPPRVTATGMFGTRLRGWASSIRPHAGEPGRRATFRDLLTGHVSLSRRLFEALGGFDPALRCHEDYELGYRAVVAGVPIAFVPGASAVHHETTDLAKALRRKEDEGIADVALCRRYPELAEVLPLGWPPPPSRWTDRLTALAWRDRPAGDRLARRLERRLRWYEWWQLRFRWRACLEALLAYRYACGVAQAAGTREALATLLAARPALASAPLTLDLVCGIEAGRVLLDRHRPASVRFVHGGVWLGTVPPEPGAERLAGRHLPALIVRCVPREYLAAEARAGRLPPLLAAEALRLTPLPDQSGVRVA